jgi:hypothetical protein
MAESDIYDVDTKKIWAQSKWWCYENGLAAFWEYANSRGAEFTCMRLFYGDRVQITESFASLKFGDVEVALRRARGSIFVSLWINNVKMLTYLHEGDSKPCDEPKTDGAQYNFSDKPSDWPAGVPSLIVPVLVRASAVSLGALLAQLAQETGYCHQDYNLPRALFAATDVISDDD